MNAKSLIKSTLRKYGYDIVRYAQVPNRSFPVLPLIVKNQLATKLPFFFVQIGANDGVLDDPLRDLIIEYHLAGLLIEPLPDFFEKLRKNYKDQPQLIFENIAIATKEALFTMYRVKSDARVLKEWHGMASFEKKHLLGEKIPDKYIEPYVVQALTLQTVLTKHHIDQIDLLQVDTEGYDGEIVRSTLNSGFLPKIINYEQVHLSSAERTACKQLLTEKGYYFLDVGKDTLAVHEACINWHW